MCTPQLPSTLWGACLARFFHPIVPTSVHWDIARATRTSELFLLLLDRQPTRAWSERSPIAVSAARSAPHQLGQVDRVRVRPGPP